MLPSEEMTTVKTLCGLCHVAVWLVPAGTILERWVAVDPGTAGHGDLMIAARGHLAHQCRRRSRRRERRARKQDWRKQ